MKTCFSNSSFKISWWNSKHTLFCFFWKYLCQWFVISKCSLAIIIITTEIKFSLILRRNVFCTKILKWRTVTRSNYLYSQSPMISPITLPWLNCKEISRLLVIYLIMITQSSDRIPFSFITMDTVFFPPCNAK